MLNYRLEIKGASLYVRLEDPLQPRRILYYDTVSKDRALAPLVQTHIRANAGRALDTLSFQEILIVPSAVRSLAETGRLYFQKQKLVAKRARLHWKELEAFLDELPLASVDHLFPGFAVSKEQWIEYETKVSWKWVERFRSGKLFLQGAELKRFLDEEPLIAWPKKGELETKPL